MFCLYNKNKTIRYTRMVENGIKRESKRKVGNSVCSKNKKIKTEKNGLYIDTFIRTQNNSFKVKATEKNIEPVKEYIQHNKIFSFTLVMSNKEKEKFRFSNKKNDYHFYYYISSSDTIGERMVNENNRNKFRPLNFIKIKEITEYNDNKSFGVSLNVIFQVNEDSVNLFEKFQFAPAMNMHNIIQSDNIDKDFISYYNERIEEKVINKRKHFYVYIEFSDIGNKNNHYYSAIIELCIFNCSTTILKLYNDNYPDFLTFRCVQEYYSKLSFQQTNKNMNIKKYSPTGMLTPNFSPIPLYASRSPSPHELNLDTIGHTSSIETTGIPTLNFDPTQSEPICSMQTPAIVDPLIPSQVTFNQNEMTNPTSITSNNYLNLNSQNNLSLIDNNSMPFHGQSCLNTQSTIINNTSLNSLSCSNDTHNPGNYVQSSVNGVQLSINNIYYSENGEYVQPQIMQSPISQSPISQSPINQSPINDYPVNINFPSINLKSSNNEIVIPYITINGYRIDSSQQGQSTNPKKLILDEQSSKNLFLNISGIDIIDNQSDSSEANNYLISYFEIIQKKSKFYSSGNDISNSSSSHSSISSDREDYEGDLDENKEFDVVENACQQIKKVFEDGSKKYFVHSSPYIIGDNTTILYNSKLGRKNNLYFFVVSKGSEILFISDLVVITTYRRSTDKKNKSSGKKKQK